MGHCAPAIAASGPTTPVCCPSCAAAGPVAIGPLPHRRTFAGRMLEHAIPGGALYRCQACALAFRAPRLPDLAYAQLYDNAIATNWQDNATRKDFELVVSRVRALPRGARILDFGCNTGELLERIGPDYERHGIEINAAAAALARRHGEGVWPSLEEIPRGMTFDAVVMMDVIEHLADPRRLLEEIQPFLGEEGILIITTGDSGNRYWRWAGSRWWYCAPPEHISFISRPWLDGLGLQLTPRHVERFRYLDLPLPRRCVDAVLAFLYALGPVLYTRALQLLKRALGREGDVPIRGAGLTRDHLFTVLHKERTPHAG